MTTEMLHEPAENPNIVATDVSLDDYMEHYAALGMEWVEGVVYSMAPIGLKHEEIRDYLRGLLQAYFSLRPIGRVVGEPFVMRLPEFPKRRREPDLMVILKTNPGELKETYMDGSADICIEIVSAASSSVDRGDKFVEYEKGGVTEYWIIDPLRKEARFYKLDDAKVYAPQPSENGLYTTAQLPDLMLDIATLWQPQMPDFYDVADMVRNMLSDKDKNNGEDSV